MTNYKQQNSALISFQGCKVWSSLFAVITHIQDMQQCQSFGAFWQLSATVPQAVLCHLLSYTHFNTASEHTLNWSICVV